ncbi:SRPBCC family protein [Rossellomorea sp. SC111]|uniref:SRPBCC family protein n=1 Tax=Rossellomorea sp. SC111 TaxID=2968985 RepID=UPI00215A331F|nr:SRPBCC family protein [Rossellomorea sp. SC111]MCR8848490.1 SRPBCC family protein [Rossellomorea sp. SC111]
MNNISQMKIQKPAHEIFEAFVDPEKIGGFWFSSSSERWEEGKTVTLRYEEYDAQGDIHILEIEDQKKIVFEWAGNHKVTITFSQEEKGSTIVGVTEEGFDENSENFISQLVDNKEGWVYMLTCLKGYMEYGVNLRASLVK